MGGLNKNGPGRALSLSPADGQISGVVNMPAKSAAQQKAAGSALAAKRGDMPKAMASTSRKGKPEHVGQSA